MFTCIVLGAVCAFMLLATTDVQQVIETSGRSGWFKIATAEEGGGDVGDGEGGVLQVYIWTHQGTPAVAYAENLSNASGDCFAHANTLNEQMTGNVPYDTAFDILYKVRVNTTQAYNSTGSKWELDWVRSNLTCASLSIGAETAMAEVEIVNNTNYMWVNYYLNNGGSGYTITHGQNVNMTFKLEAWM